MAATLDPIHRHEARTRPTRGRQPRGRQPRASRTAGGRQADGILFENAEERLADDSEGDSQAKGDETALEYPGVTGNQSRSSC